MNIHDASATAVSACDPWWRTGLADPDPAVRLAVWRSIARKHVTAGVCDSLARCGFPALACELLRQRGDLP